MTDIKLDVKNLKLIAELEKDGKAPISRIAKKIGVSKEVAQYRFKQLLTSKFITKFDAIIDYFSMGYQCYKLIVNLRNLKYHMRNQIIDELRKSELIQVNIYLFSDWDLEIDMWVKDPQDFYDFYDKFIQKYSEYIAEKEFALITRVHFRSNEYLHKGKNHITLGDKIKVDIDETDEKIIDAIERNPREEILTLANELNLPAHTVHYRTDQLIKKGVIRGIIPILNVSQLGYNKYSIQIILSQPSQKKEVLDYLKSKPEVTRISEFIGKKDISFEANFKINVDLDKFLEEMRLHTSAIQDFEVMNVVL